MSTPSTNLIVSGTGAVYMQNLAVQGNSIIATNTDGSIQFVPNGNGVIGFGDVGFNNGVISTTITDLDIVLSPDGNGVVKTGNLQLTENTISTTNVDGDLLLAPNGSGNIGIGTSSPSSKLHVYSSASGEPLSYFQSNGDASIRINGQGGEAYIEYMNQHTTTSNAWKTGVNDTNKFELSYGSPGSANSNLYGLTMDTSGNVGIGTTIPSAMLDVSGLIKTNHLSLGTNLYPTIGGNWLTIFASTFNGNIGPNAPNPEGGILFSNSSSNSSFPWGFYMGTVKYAASTGFPTTRFDIGTSASLESQHTTTSYANTLSPKMSIDAYGRVGVGTTSPAEKLDVSGTIRHQGLTLNEGTTPNVDEIKTFTKNLSVSTSWIDTGIIGTDLSDGSYIVQLFDNINSGLGHYSMSFTGIMSWYSSNVTGDTAYNEILLHNAGHAVNGNPLFLRTQMQHTPGYLKLQIRCATNSGSGDFTFKFRRMI